LPRSIRERQGSARATGADGRTGGKTPKQFSVLLLGPSPGYRRLWATNTVLRLEAWNGAVCQSHGPRDRRGEPRELAVRGEVSDQRTPGWEDCHAGHCPALHTVEMLAQGRSNRVAWCQPTRRRRQSADDATQPSRRRGPDRAGGHAARASTGSSAARGRRRQRARFVCVDQASDGQRRRLDPGYRPRRLLGRPPTGCRRSAGAAATAPVTAVDLAHRQS
jgi:hypothetical protein